MEATTRHRRRFLHSNPNPTPSARVYQDMTLDDVQRFFMAIFDQKWHQHFANFKAFMNGQTCGVNHAGQTVYYKYDINRFLSGLPCND